MNSIAETISKAIKEGKWLDITYQNLENSETHFWIAIEDIDAKTKTFSCKIFNHNKSFNSLNAHIKFDQIKSATILFFTSFETPSYLFEKLSQFDPDDISWLEYDKYNSNILNYYIECSLLDCDPYQKDYCMIEGIDLSILRKNKIYTLSNEQQKKLLEKVYHNKDCSSYKELIISSFSITKNQKKYVVCYYPLTYNPSKNQLIVSNKLSFNYSFIVDGKKNSLYKYVDTDVDIFINKFQSNYQECREEIESHLKSGEVIDTRPDIMILERDIPVNLSETYNEIENTYRSQYGYSNDSTKKEKLSKPLQAFFGNLTKTRSKEKIPSLVLYDKKVNIDQMRVLYNSMTQPVTYVQGPPGTGKTQTILNVILCGFVANKTMLITSANNTPIDGIIKKLNFKYYDKDVIFPYLRLGNFDETIKAAKRILELYDYYEKRKPNETLINHILNLNDSKNEALRIKLSQYEERLELYDLINSGEKLIESFHDKKSKIINMIKRKVQENKNKLNEMPYIEDDDVVSLFTPISNDNQFLSYLYFKSLEYIQKLKKPKYQELIDICKEKDEQTLVKKFNSWIKNDDNLKLLTKAFPIILTTNISSARLGTTKTKFDLSIIDEAGQCNVAHSLLPIARAKNLLLVGDINQLKPIILLEDSVNNELLEKFNVDSTYSYKDNSILSVMKKHDSISKNILLSYHYRCGKNIINFSNKRYYNSELKTDKIKVNGELYLLDGKNNNSLPSCKNQNIDEAMGIINYIKRNNVKNATIITPFVNQENLINKLLNENKIEDVNCGTIHSLQGAEKDTIIFSTSISLKTSKKTFEWLKDNSEIINVGITRAKNKLVVAVDNEALNALSDKTDDLYSLVNYVKTNGKCLVTPSNKTIFINKSNNSKAEADFYDTISQFCSTDNSYDADRNVHFNKIFKDDPILSKSKMEFDLVLYKTGFLYREVSVVIEINGGEHFGDSQREKSDKIKREICQKNNWTFISIPNSFVKSYEEIKEIILTANKKIQGTLFD